MSIWMVLCLCLASSPIQEAQACGGGRAYAPKFSDLNQPNVLPRELLQNIDPGQTHFHIGHWNKSPTEASVFKQINLGEWAHYFGTDTDTAEARVYRREGISELAEEVQAYLSFVHDHQDLVSEDGYRRRLEGSGQEQLALAADYREAIAQGQDALAQTQDPVLRLRWLFVSMRLAHYSTDLATELALYQEHGPVLRAESSLDDSEVWFWIDSLLAGRLKRLAVSPEERAEAAYQFALIFGASESKRTEAWVNFSIQSDRAWQELMGQAKGHDEKALFHFIRAIRNDANRIAELRTILELSPDSKWANELMAWELEYAQLGGEEHLAEFRHLIDEVIEAEQQSDLFLAHFAQLYLGTLQGEEVSVSEVDRLAAFYRHDPRSRHLSHFRFFLVMASLDEIDAKTEERIARSLSSLEAEYGEDHGMRAYVYRMLAPLYQASGERTKALITSGTLHRSGGGTIEDLEIYRAFVDRSDKNAFEESLVIQGWGIALSESDLHRRKGMRALDESAYGRAVSEFAFEFAGDGTWSDRDDPFESNLRVDNSTLSTQGDSGQCQDFVCYSEEMKRLSDRLAADPTDARAHLRLGHGLYNRGGVGNMSGRMWYDPVPSEEGLGGVEAHYHSALKHAVDDEVKAQALYALAKIEFVQVTSKAEASDPKLWGRGADVPWSDKGKAWLQDEGFGESFRALGDYSHTDYYAEVIQQCALFRAASW